MNDLYIQGVHIDWNKIPVNSYLREIDAIKGLEELIFHNSITFFVGENGSGKSTLLEALAVACGFNPEGGTKNYIFSTYDSHSQLHEAIRVVKGYRQAKWGYFLRAESFYNVATKEEEYADWEHPSEKYHEKSHGESFLALAQNYLKPNGVYFFDEPEAALSPQRQLTLLMEIHACARQGSQFIIVTHSPILLGIPEAQIIAFDEEGMGVATPMGLMAMGATFDIKKAFGKIKPTVIAAFIKLVGFVAVFMPLAVVIGFRREKLIAILVMLGSATTVSSFVMAKNMGHEGVVSSSVVMLTTMCSAFTLTGWLFIMKCFGLV